MLEVAREQMGDDGDGNPLHPFVEAAVAEGGAGVQYFNAHSPGGLGNPVLRPVIEQVGATAKRMLRRRSRDGSPLGVRYYQDLLATEAPGVEGVAPRRQRPDRRSTRTSSPSPSTGPAG